MPRSAPLFALALLLTAGAGVAWMSACTPYDLTSPGATLRGTWALVDVAGQPLPVAGFLSQCAIDAGAGAPSGVLTSGTLTLHHSRVFGKPYRLAGTLALAGTGSATCKSAIVVDAPGAMPPYTATVTTPPPGGGLTPPITNTVVERIEQPATDTLRLAVFTFVRQP